MEQLTESRGDSPKRPLEGLSVFLSGPMTGYPHNNATTFAEAHAICKEAGAERIYDPALDWLTSGPHAQGYSHEDWMRRSVSELTRSTVTGQPVYQALIRLPEDPSLGVSEGATLERRVAEACGIRVIPLRLI